jgi:hypothetical protein
MHPLIEEICRARDVQPHAFGRWQRALREEIQPLLDELAARRAAEGDAGRDASLDVAVPARRGAR